MAINLLHFPDPGNARPNEPCFLVTQKHILSLYNHYHSEHCHSITNDVAKWFIAECLKRGWTDAKMIRKQCLLRMVYPEFNN